MLSCMMVSAISASCVRERRLSRSVSSSVNREPVAFRPLWRDPRVAIDRRPLSMAVSMVSIELRMAVPSPATSASLSSCKAAKASVLHRCGMVAGEKWRLQTATGSICRSSTAAVGFVLILSELAKPAFPRFWMIKHL